jgi:transposase-like protein
MKPRKNKLKIKIKKVCPECGSMNIAKDGRITGCGKNQKADICCICGHTFNIKNITPPKIMKGE